jgi:hypothetical protein
MRYLSFYILFILLFGLSCKKPGRGTWQLVLKNQQNQELVIYKGEREKYSKETDGDNDGHLKFRLSQDGSWMAVLYYKGSEITGGKVTAPSYAAPAPQHTGVRANNTYSDSYLNFQGTLHRRSGSGTFDHQWYQTFYRPVTGSAYDSLMTESCTFALEWQEWKKLKEN